MDADIVGVAAVDEVGVGVGVGVCFTKVVAVIAGVGWCG